MEEKPRPRRARIMAKKSLKVTSLMVALLIFILLLLFVLGLVVDRYFIAPTHT